MDRMYSTTLEAPSVIHVGSSRKNQGLALHHRTKMLTIWYTKKGQSKKAVL
jgi:hypothetical protein